MPFSSLRPFLPPPLPAKGTIGILSPSKWAEPAWLDALEKALSARGYTVVFHEQNRLRSGWLAGPDEARAAALMDLFQNPDVHAIMCGRGGTGALRLLDLLDYDVLRAHPKPFVGFSDVTCLLSAITRHTGMMTYHGPMGFSFGAEVFDPRTLDALLFVLGGGQTWSFPGAKGAVPGKARGPLFGGNLTLLQTLVGTAHEFRPEGGVLFIEDTEEPLYKLDRTLTHLRLAGLFDSVAAVLVGEMTDIEDEKPDPAQPPEMWYGKTIEQIVRDHVPPHVPLAFNLPCGHGKYITTFPVGADVEVECRLSEVNITRIP